jgi:hypothetical protein
MYPHWDYVREYNMGEKLTPVNETLTSEALRMGTLVDHKTNIETVLVECDTTGGDKAKAIENYFSDFLLSLLEEKPHADVFLAWIVERWHGHGAR